MNPALSRVNQERRAFPSQSVAESSWQKSMWFCLIMINVFTYFIILQAIFFFFNFSSSWRMIWQLLLINQRAWFCIIWLLTSKRMRPVVECDWSLISVFLSYTATRIQESCSLVRGLQSLELSSLGLFYDWHTGLFLLPLFSLKSILGKITHMFLFL